MGQYKSYLMAITLGIALAFASIGIVGYGAAITVPAETLRALMQISDLLAVIMVDFFTIAVPLALAFLLLAYSCKFILKTTDYKFFLLLLAPLVLLHAYFLLQSPQQLNLIAPMVVRYLLLTLCFYFLVRSTKQTNT